MFPELSTRRDEYLRRFPKFNRPKIIGFFSLDTSRNIVHDHSRLKFVRSCADCIVNFDLNHDLDIAVRADQTRDERIQHLLKYLLDQQHQLNYIPDEPVSSLQQARFACYRGLFTLIANTPYENQEGWRVVATLHRGEIFLGKLYTEEERKRKQEMTEKDKQFTSWGYKFEQYVLSDSPTSLPNLSVPNNENEEFSLVFTSELGTHKLFYMAEMDGVLCQSNADLPPNGGHEEVVEYLRDKKFIELKTNRHFQYPKQETNFRRFKARKWWCQSFLAGVETILCGFRDDRGIVDELKVYRVADLPRMCCKFWNPDVCFNFLDTFLTYVKRCLAREIARKHGEAVLGDITRAPTTSLHFKWNPHQRVRVTEYDPHEDLIVPDWFIKSYGKNEEMVMQAR